MGRVLDKKYTKADSTAAILKAIEKLATDKLGRVLLTDQCEWLETKMKEIARLARILKGRHKHQ